MAPSGGALHPSSSAALPYIFEPSAPWQRGWQPGSGLEFVVGGNLGFGTTRNNYEDFPTFSSDGLAAGGHAALRHYFQSNFFAALEVGGVGADIRGTNSDGAFLHNRWQTWEMGQAGFTWTPPSMTTPVTIYGGAGFTQGRFVVGIESDFVNEAMSKTLGGFVLRTGGEIYVAPNVSIGASYQFSQFKGTIDGSPVKTQINMLLLSIDYHSQVY